MAQRQFVTWNTLATPHGNASWAVIEVRSALGEMAKQLGALPPKSVGFIL
jgi:hypothetical protein